MAIIKQPLAGQWKSVTEIFDCLRRARDYREQQKTLLTDLEGRVERRRTDFAQTLADLPAAERLKVITRVTNGLRSDLKRQTADTRLAFVKSIARIKEDVERVKPHYTSPMQLLMRDSIGSERRSRITYQLETSGPAELVSLAALAVATADREMGAAVAARTANMSVDQRRFSLQDLVEHLTGEDYRRVNQAFLEIERLMAEAVQADTAFETGHPNGQRAIQIALRKRDERAIGTDLSNLDELISIEPDKPQSASVASS